MRRGCGYEGRVWLTETNKIGKSLEKHGEMVSRAQGKTVREGWLWVAMTSKKYAVTAQLGTCFLCLISHFLPVLPIGHFQQRPEYKGGWWAWHIGQPPGQSTTGWEWIPGANERSEVLLPSSFSVTLLNVNRLLKVQDRWTFSTWKRSKSDRQTSPKQVNRGKSEGVDYVVKKNFKKEFRGHMEQTKKIKTDIQR